MATNKYSKFVTKKCPQYKTYVYYSHGSAREPKTTLTCLINGSENLITLISKAFLFKKKGEHLILVLLCKANLEHKEICASDWLKPCISVLLTHIHFVFFLFCIPDLALCYKKPIYNSSIGSIEEH